MLPSTFLDELRGRTPLHTLVGRKVKLERRGRQWKGCCPFHSEKSASFYVYPDHYHCFGCGAHGDAIAFLTEGEGLPFREAVERLAAEAGMDVPQDSPKAAQRAEEAKSLQDVLAAAQDAFTRRLKLPEGAEGLAYLRKRGLSDETIARFGLGWSGSGRGALTADLRAQGITPEQMLAAGLLLERDGRLVDLYFDRVTFPIRNERGRVIAFGGRVLGDAKPKYINGSESPVFSKRRSLYGLDLAREGIFRGAAPVVVEGYLDVIALHEAGFRGAVAPLGTALTEEQLQLLWGINPEPVLCFDGDSAGSKAAARAVELAMGLLEPGRSIRIMTLPVGQDPDSLVRERGAAAFQQHMAVARPLHEVLYTVIERSIPAGTPEARAQLRHRLETAAGQIKDKALAQEYRKALLDQFYRAARPGAPSRGAKGMRYARPTEVGDQVRVALARIVLHAAAHHPDVLDELEEQLAMASLPRGRCADLRDALLRDRTLPASDLGWLQGADIPPEVTAHAAPDEAVAIAQGVLTRLQSEQVLTADLEAAVEAFAAGDAAAEARLITLNRELLALRAGEPLEDALC
ncbi:DNA primase [Rhodovarius crocodyli]|uniref:DNA primase n=1 Tax=Rhodovarius crocodyli TaxID=1979269 RepID=A0A437MF03_9PROT|nr:DNA primase [Rhodovarius crocodyli]RVT96192.1 DNA primase [Rhodovarius crocodyli]